MRDQTHTESVERWAVFVKKNPHAWKEIHKKFIDAQFTKSRSFLKRILQTPKGKEKVITIYNIKNVEGYKKIL